MGIIEQGKLVSFRYFIEGSPAELAQRLVHYVREEAVTSVHVYGSGCSFGFIKGLQGRADLEVTKMNPFRRVPMSTDLVDSGIARGQEHRFVACIGVALRKE